MILAMDPVIVRLPASVEAIAPTSHSGDREVFDKRTQSITAGTLLTTFERADDSDGPEMTYEVEVADP
jgi:hypothetical protein